MLPSHLLLQMASTATSIQWIPKAAHLVVMTHPEQVAKAIVAALAGEASKDLSILDRPKKRTQGKL